MNPMQSALLTAIGGGFTSAGNQMGRYFADQQDAQERARRRALDDEQQKWLQTQREWATSDRTTQLADHDRAKAMKDIELAQQTGFTPYTAGEQNHTGVPLPEMMGLQLGSLIDPVFSAQSKKFGGYAKTQLSQDEQQQQRAKALATALGLPEGAPAGVVSEVLKNRYTSEPQIITPDGQPPMLVDKNTGQAKPVMGADGKPLHAKPSALDRIAATIGGQNARMEAANNRSYASNRNRAQTNYRMNPAVSKSAAEAKALTSLIQLVDQPGAVADKELTMSLARVLLPGQAADVQTLRSLATVGGVGDRMKRWMMQAKTGESVPPHIREEIRSIIAPRIQSGEELVAPLQDAGAQQLRADAALFGVPDSRIPADSASSFPNPYQGLKPSMQRLKKPTKSGNPF